MKFKEILSVPGNYIAWKKNLQQLQVCQVSLAHTALLSNAGKATLINLSAKANTTNASVASQSSQSQSGPNVEEWVVVIYDDNSVLEITNVSGQLWEVVEQTDISGQKID